MVALPILKPLKRKKYNLTGDFFWLPFLDKLYSLLFVNKTWDFSETYCDFITSHRGSLANDYPKDFMKKWAPSQALLYLMPVWQLTRIATLHTCRSQSLSISVSLYVSLPPYFLTSTTRYLHLSLSMSCLFFVLSISLTYIYYLPLSLRLGHCVIYSL